MGDGGGEHWLVRMEWRPAVWSVCLPLLIFPCTIKSRSSLLAPAHPGGPGKRAFLVYLRVCAFVINISYNSCISECISTKYLAVNQDHLILRFIISVSVS